jgi:antitoxin component YwqK of YwqJK toxin-antitoxin module
MNTLFLLHVLITLFVVLPADEKFPGGGTFHAKHNADNDPYIAYHENGNRKFFLVYKKNKLTGDWKSWYPSGMSCDSGRFSGNAPDGTWKGWYPDGSVRYTWNVSASKLSALKDELLRQPKIKQFAISQKHVTDAVKYYQSDYLFKQPVKKHKVSFRSNLVHSKNYDLSSIEQKVNKNTVETTGEYVPPFPEMLLHGEFASFHPGGKIREEGVYINGLREGVWEETTIEGIKNRGSYHHGYKSGEWRNYDKQGKLSQFTQYKNGEVTEKYDFSPNRRP